MIERTPGFGAATFALILATAGCGDDGTTVDPDAGPSVDAGSDAGSDAGADAGSDAGSDAGMDAGIDGGPISPECGDHVLDPGEVCDEEFSANEYVCATDCQSCDWRFDPMNDPEIFTLSGGSGPGDLTFGPNCVIWSVNSNFDYLNELTMTDIGVEQYAVLGPTAFELSYGLAYLPSDGKLYQTTDHRMTLGSSELWSATPGGSQTPVMEFGERIYDLEVAPSGFGAYGGMLIGVGDQGSVIVIDPDMAMATTIGTTTGSLNGLAFAADGSLAYISNYSGGKIQTMTSAGVFADFYPGLNEPSAVAMHPDGTRIVVYHDAVVDPMLGGSHNLDEISIPGAVLTAGYALVGGSNIDRPTAILFDKGGDLLITSARVVHHFTF